MQREKGQTGNEPGSLKVPMRNTGADRSIVAKKSGNADGAKGPNDRANGGDQPERERVSGEGKTQAVSKTMVWRAYKRVRTNRGAAGVDRQSLEEFGKDLRGNLYKLWNRMASGSYMPPPVLKVEIPKDGGGVRRLGIPTVADRIAQTVVTGYLEVDLEPLFHPDSYGYRRGKSAIQAVGKARRCCWEKDWVIDLDIKGFFDNLDHELVLKAVRRHVKERWVMIYVERWLKAPIQDKDGRLENREKGTPQGGVISPLLANLFLHYAFDVWIRKQHAEVQFERYADDIIVHAESREEAEQLLEEIRGRLAACKLELNEEKTKTVYCKDGRRKGDHAHTSFDFLGYTFRARRASKSKGEVFTGFLPAMSKKAANRIRKTIRSWKLPTRWCPKSLEEIAVFVNPKVRGWLNYYGSYYVSECKSVLKYLQEVLVRWACRKHKRLRGHFSKGKQWLGRIAQRQPDLLVLWQHGVIPSVRS